MEPLFRDGNEHVDADGNPYLCFDGIGRCAAERFDSQVLLDPLEKQLDLPALFVDIGHCLSGKEEYIGEEDETLPGFRVHVGDTPQGLRIESSGFLSSEKDCLICPKS